MAPILLNPYRYAATPPSGFAALAASLSPVWWHRLNTLPGGMGDSSGNTRHGSYANVTAAAAGYVGGDADGAKTYGATSQGLVPYGSWMTATSFTVLATITPTTISGSTNGIVSRYTHDFSTSQFFMRLDNNKLAGVIFGGGGSNSAVGSTSLSTGTTYDVAMTWDGLNIKVYVNGVLDGSSSRSTIGGGNTALSIGKDLSNDEPFYGDIDEVAYFVNNVLTATDLSNLRTARLGTGYAAAVMAFSPAGYWRQGDSLAYTDASGNGYTVGVSGLPVSGGTSLVTTDLTDKSTTFNGSSSVYTTYASGLNLSTFTACAIIKPSSVSGNQTIIARHSGSPTQWLMRLEGSNLRAYIQHSSTYYGTTGTVAISSGTAYHVACSYDGTTLRLYRNGTQVDSVAHTGVNSDTNSPLTVGSSYGSGTFAEFYNGVIDEPMLFSGALSGADIASLAAAAGY